MKVEKLTIYYNNIKAVDSISFNLEKGSICTIIGQSGAGKSTVLKTFKILSKELK